MAYGKNRSFTYSPTGEPHHRRRAEILEKHPEIRRLFGRDIRPLFVTIAIVAAQLGLAAALNTASIWLILPAAYFVGSILNHWAAMTVHECSHNLVMRTVNGNRWLALFANIPFVAPMAMSFIRYHVEHHTYLGVLGRDSDLPHAFEVRVIANHGVRKFFWLSLYLIVYSLRGLTFMGKPNRWEILNVALQIPVNIAIWYFLGPWALGYLALSTFFGMSLHPVAAHFVHEHYTFAEEQETYSYYGPLNLVTYNVGYHNEHHDFMNVPGFRLPELKRIASEYYDGLKSHRSWTFVLWHFIMSPEMGAASRIVRSSADFKRGREQLRETRRKKLETPPRENPVKAEAIS